MPAAAAASAPPAASDTVPPPPAAPAADAPKDKKPRKPRTTNPGVRVQGGRIYDSENGTTCHQVRGEKGGSGRRGAARRGDWGREFSNGLISMLPACGAPRCFERWSSATVFAALRDLGVHWSRVCQPNARTLRTADGPHPFCFFRSGTLSLESAACFPPPHATPNRAMRQQRLPSHPRSLCVASDRAGSHIFHHPSRPSLSVPPKNCRTQGQVHRVHPLLVPALPEQPLRRASGAGECCCGWRPLVTGAAPSSPVVSTPFPAPAHRTGHHPPHLVLPPLQGRLQLLQLPQAGGAVGDWYSGHCLPRRRVWVGVRPAGQESARQAAPAGGQGGGG